MATPRLISFLSSKHSTHFLLGFLFLTGLSVTTALLQISLVYAGSSGFTVPNTQTVPSKPGNATIIPPSETGIFNGYWQGNNPSEALNWNMQDNGQNINGSLDTATYTHQLQGTHFSREQASVTIYRTYRGVPSCTTKMFGNMTSSSPFQMTIAIQGTDGNCDLARDFSSSVIYFKR